MYGDIADTAFGKNDVTAKCFHDDLQSLGDVSVLNVRINSGGGSVWAAIAMYNELKRHSARKVARIDALAASAATLVMVACDEVIMSSNARIMIHNPTSDVEGDAAAFRSAARLLSDARGILADAYTARTKRPRNDIIAMMDAETWMTADDALRLGFCDRIESGIPIAAHYKNGALVLAGVQHDLNRYRNPPTIWTKKERMSLKVKKRLKIKNEVVEGATALLTTCPECGHEFEVVVDPVVVDEGMIEVDLPIETTEQAEELVARVRGLNIQNSVGASVTCPECGHSFDVVVEDGPAGDDAGDSGLEEALVEVVEELLDEELSIPDDPIEAKAYIKGIRAGIKAKGSTVNATSRKGATVLAARVRDAQASGAYKIKAGFAPAVNTKAAKEARRTETATAIAKYANRGKGEKKNG